MRKILTGIALAALITIGFYTQGISVPKFGNMEAQAGLFAREQKPYLMYGVGAISGSYKILGKVRYFKDGSIEVLTEDGTYTCSQGTWIVVE